MASTSFADVLPTQTTRTIGFAVLAVVAAAGVGACGSSSASDDDRYVNRSSQITSTPTATVRSTETETETSVIRTTTPTRRTTTRSTPNTQARTTVRGSVPAILVGTWGGGSSGETAGSSYTFTSDGRFQIRRYGASITGVAVARGSTITFYFSGKSVTSSYSVSELPELYGYRSLNLQIDGYSYVRDI
jgi:hypothetical protein